jgi:hypothetical protein
MPGPPHPFVKSRNHRLRASRHGSRLTESEQSRNVRVMPRPHAGTTAAIGDHLSPIQTACEARHYPTSTRTHHRPTPAPRPDSPISPFRHSLGTPSFGVPGMVPGRRRHSACLQDAAPDQRTHHPASHRNGDPHESDTNSKGAQPAGRPRTRGGGSPRARRLRFPRRRLRGADRIRRRGELHRHVRRHDQARLPQLSDRWHGDLGADRLQRPAHGRGRDQRRRRHPRQADRVRPGRRRHRLADLRGEDREAAHSGLRRRDLRRLDLVVPQGGQAGRRREQRPVLLPGAVRGPRVVAEHLLHRRDHESADHPRDGLPRRSGREDAVPGGLRLRVPAHRERDHQAVRRRTRDRDRRRGVRAPRQG